MRVKDRPFSSSECKSAQYIDQFMCVFLRKMLQCKSAQYIDQFMCVLASYVVLRVIPLFENFVLFQHQHVY